MWDRLTAPEDGFSKLQRENLTIIESYGKALMEVVCRDACDGHEISRVSADLHAPHLFIFVFVFIALSSAASCASDAGPGGAGPDPLHRPSEPVAGLHL